MKPYKSEETHPVIILTCDAVHDRIKGLIYIVVLVQFEDGDVAMEFNSDGYGLDTHGNDVRLLVELSEAPKHEFKPFDKVLVRDSYCEAWRPDIFSFMAYGPLYSCLRSDWRYCIPYKGNEHLVGTTNNIKED